MVGRERKGDGGDGKPTLNINADCGPALAHIVLNQSQATASDYIGSYRGNISLITTRLDPYNVTRYQTTKQCTKSSWTDDD